MRLLSAILVLLLSAASFANEVQVVKVFDGTRAYCQKKSDVFRYRQQAYSVSSVSLEQDGGQLTLSFNVVMKSCVEEEGNFFFRVVDPLEDFSYNTIIGVEGDQAIWNRVTVHTVDFQGTMYRDGIYKVLYRQNVANGVRLSIPVVAVLTAEELVRFDNGEEITLGIDFHLNRKVVFSSERTNYEHRDMIHYGAFRFHFSVQKVADKALIKLL